MRLINQTFKVIAIVAFMFSCVNSALEDPEKVLSSEALLLEVGKASIRYAAQDTTTVTARIPKDAGILDVKFTATHGAFIASAAKTINQRTEVVDENYRYAIVRFTSDSSATSVYIMAEVSTLRERITLKFTK